MEIYSEFDYCDSEICPIKKDNLFYATTRISVNVGDIAISIAIPCLMCKHMKLLNMDKILEKSYTKSLLKD